MLKAIELPHVIAKHGKKVTGCRLINSRTFRANFASFMAPTRSAGCRLPLTRHLLFPIKYPVYYNETATSYQSH
jgi:hypothetical protein